MRLFTIYRGNWSFGGDLGCWALPLRFHYSRSEGFFEIQVGPFIACWISPLDW